MNSSFIGNARAITWNLVDTATISPASMEQNSATVNSATRAQLTSRFCLAETESRLPCGVFFETSFHRPAPPPSVLPPPESRSLQENLRFEKGPDVEKFLLEIDELTPPEITFRIYDFACTLFRQHAPHSIADPPQRLYPLDQTLACLDRLKDWVREKGLIRQSLLSMAPYITPRSFRRYIENRYAKATLGAVLEGFKSMARNPAEPYARPEGNRGRTPIRGRGPEGKAVGVARPHETGASDPVSVPEGISPDTDGERKPPLQTVQAPAGEARQIKQPQPRISDGLSRAERRRRREAKRPSSGPETPEMSPPLLDRNLLRRVEKFLKAARPGCFTIKRPLVKEIEAVRDMLARRGKTSLPFWSHIALLERHIAGPSIGEIDRYVFSTIPLSPEQHEFCRGLSILARKGLYALAVTLRPACYSHVGTFLQNPAARSKEKTIESALELVALLYERGVHGSEQGFLPTVRDQKFLGNNPIRVETLLAEYLEALFLASNASVARVRMSPSLIIDWSHLSDEEKKYLRRIDPEDWTVGRQRFVQADLMYITEDGKKRLVEIKGGLKGTYSASDRKYALKQMFRYIALARQYGIERVEYLIHGNTVPDFVQLVETTFAQANVPYRIRTLDRRGSQAKVVEDGVAISTPMPEIDYGVNVRPWPFPPNPDSTAKRPAFDGASSTNAPPFGSPKFLELWNKIMPQAARDCLTILPGSSRQEIFTQMATFLDRTSPVKLLTDLKACLESGAFEAPDSVRKKILHRIDHSLYGLERGYLSRRRIVQDLFDIVGLAEYEENSQSTQNDIPRELLLFLKFYGPLLESRLRDFLGDIEAAVEYESGTSAETPEKMTNLLEEYSPDRPLDITVNQRGEGGWTLLQILDAIASGQVDADLQEAWYLLEKICAPPNPHQRQTD